MTATILGRPRGVGVGWRRGLARFVDRNPSFELVEVLAEDFRRGEPVPASLHALLARGTTVVPHSVSLSLAGAERPDVARLRALDALARQLKAPLVSDHIAFVRGGGIESGHLLPPARTQDSLDVLVENVRTAKAHLSVPLALENIAGLFEWPGAEMDDATFVGELLRRTDSFLLLDVANLYANALNFGWDAKACLEQLPLDRLAYVHIAGGHDEGGFYHDTHADAVARGPLELLEWLCEQVEVPGVLLERDDRFPPAAELEAEVGQIRLAVARGSAAREA